MANLRQLWLEAKESFRGSRKDALGAIERNKGTNLEESRVLAGGCMAVGNGSSLEQQSGR